MGTKSFPGVKSGRGVTLIPHPLLVPWSGKSRAILLLPLWAVRPVHSLSACKRVHFNFNFTFTFTVLTNKSTQSSLLSLYNFKNIKLQHVSDLTGPSSGSTLHYCIRQLLNNIWPPAYVEELMGIFRVRWIGTADRTVTHQTGAAYRCNGLIYGIKNYVYLSFLFTAYFANNYFCVFFLFAESAQTINITMKILKKKKNRKTTPEMCTPKFKYTSPQVVISSMLTAG